MTKKGAIDAKTVRHIAQLSRISLRDNEIELYGRQLAQVLGYIDKLNEADVSNTIPTSHPLESLKNVFRKDKARKSLTQEQALQNAPKKKDNFFSVPKVIE